jgi:hypothetical protein
MMGMGLSLMEFGEMTMNDVRAVARLYNELACFIKNETKDEYFDIDTFPNWKSN